MQHFSADFCSRFFLMSLLVLTALTSTTQVQHATVAQADSLKALFRKRKPDDNRVQIQLKLSDFYQRWALDGEQSKERIFQAVAIHKSIGYRTLCGTGHALAGETINSPSGTFIYLSNTSYVAVELTHVTHLACGISPEKQICFSPLI
jgi:hypothetical protein